MFGAPDDRYPDPDDWVNMLATSRTCEPRNRITSAWRYSPILHDDAMVFFDANEQVVCVREGGAIFDVRSY